MWGEVTPARLAVMPWVEGEGEVPLLEGVVWIKNKYFLLLENILSVLVCTHMSFASRWGKML